jgi:hypothetical protein
VLVVFNVFVAKFLEKSAFSAAAKKEVGDCEMSLISLNEK